MTAQPDRVLHISDVHFGAEDRRALDAFAKAVDEVRPHAIVCTGDLTQRARHSQFAAAQQWFSSLGVPVMLAPGNHDMPYYNLLERFRRPYARFDGLNAAAGSAIELQHAVIVPLDTNVTAQWRFPWSDGVIKQGKLEATLKRLAELQAAGDERLKIVACHHPLLPARDGDRNPTIRGERAFAALAAAGADAILSGHVHVPFDMVRERGGHAIRMIGAGTLSTRLRGANPSWNLLTITKGQIDLETIFPLGK